MGNYSQCTYVTLHLFENKKLLGDQEEARERQTSADIAHRALKFESHFI